MNVYLDSSFLVSLYSADSNSAAAVKALRSASGVLSVTTFAELEVVNAFGFRIFRKEVLPAQAEASLHHFEEDLRTGIFHLKALPEGVFGRAGRLSRQTTARLGTRTADLLHVAAALELGSDRFFSFDRQQRKLAETVKFKLNPLA